MDMHVVYFLLVGAVAGWLAGILTKGRGFGLIGDIVVGVIGAVIGGWLAQKLGMSFGAGVGGEILIATGGAIVLLIVIRILVGKK